MQAACLFSFCITVSFLQHVSKGIELFRNKNLEPDYVCLKQMGIEYFNLHGQNMFISLFHSAVFHNTPFDLITVKILHMSYIISSLSFISVHCISVFCQEGLKDAEKIHNATGTIGLDFSANTLWRYIKSQ